MFFSIKQSIQSSSDLPRTFLKNMVQWMNKFIEDNKLALIEIRNLRDPEIIKQMHKVVTNYLPDADPKAIVDAWLLALSTDSYESYIKWVVVDHNIKAWRTLVEKENDKYMNTLGSWLKWERKQTNMWNYYFEMKKLHESCPLATLESISIDHATTLQAKCITKANGSIELVEKDDIGLEDFKRDIEPEFISFHNKEIQADREKNIAESIGDDFIPNNHIKALSWFSACVWGA